MWACQDSCPSGAIVFGDVINPESKVSASLKNERNYGLLDELNTQPAVKYQSKIRNTHALKGASHGEHA
jgi:Fe-S-cluster-containing dehydrogenase component